VSRRLCLCLFLFCVLFFGAEASEPQIVIGDSAFISCRCQKSVFPCGAVERFLKQHPRVPPGFYLRNVCDSLGFFHARWDTLPDKRYTVHLGGRAIIASEKLSDVRTVTLDLLSQFSCPRSYDAGEIGSRVAEVGRCLAERGYPFAAIAVSINPPDGAAASADTIRRDTLTVTYSISDDRQCVFAAPRLMGARATKQRLLARDVLVKTGEPFDIRKVEATREALLRRPYIADVMVGEFAALPETARESAFDRDHEYVSVPFFIKDRTGLGIEGALGFNSRQGGKTFLQGDLTLSFLNLFHSGESASLLYAGDRTYQKFHVEASKPWLFGYPLQASASFGVEIHENSYGYLSGDATALLELQNDWTAGITARGTETSTDSSRRTWQYFGVDFLLSRVGEPLQKNIFSSELSLAAGGGIADRERNFTRSHVEFTGGIHAPLWGSQAFRVRVVSKHLITDEDTNMLVAAEKFRVGGYRSVRGYSENEFAFRTVAYNQLEYLYYFSRRGSAYIFLDDGFGFERSLTRARWGERTIFLGYGLGIRVPAKLGTLTLEWARNRSDRSSWGRINVKVTNNNTF
jgi:outer membrane protein assembly factor BamA